MTRLQKSIRPGRSAHDSYSEVRATTMPHPCTQQDLSGWLRLRLALWPEASEESHLAEMRAFLAQPQRYAQFLSLDEAGLPAGMIEASLRTDHVNGTE